MQTFCHTGITGLAGVVKSPELPLKLQGKISRLRLTNLFWALAPQSLIPAISMQESGR